MLMIKRNNASALGLLSVVGLFVLSLTSASRRDMYYKECSGSLSISLSTSGSSVDQYNKYKHMYENCTSISNNLVLTHLTGDFDLSFLSSITEVYGCVYIAINEVSVIPLHNLTVIRGASVYKETVPPNSEEEEFSLFVAGNNGLKELQMPALQEIMDGNVLFKNNKQLCFEQTIDWSYILTRDNAKPFFVESHNRTCRGETQHLVCDESCRWGDKRYCWGQGSDMCQTLTSLNCSRRCTSNNLRCYGPNDIDCCDEECAGGCTGFLDRDCLACRNFENDGRCVPDCPLKEKLNRKTGLMEPNPDFKYRYNGQCVKTCGMMKYQDIFCVSQCKDGYEESTSNHTCMPCNGGCRKDMVKCLVPDNSPVSNETIKLFINCTHVVGSILIHNSSFMSTSNKPGITVDDLEVLNQVEEISNYLYVDSYIPTLKSLSFLKNLKVISGHSPYSSGQNQFALVIQNSSLEYLGLESLKEIRAAYVAVTQNPHLCYTEGLEFKDFFSNRDQQLRVVSRNENNTICEEKSQICSEECEGGCWGPGPGRCVRCKRYLFEDRCLSECILPGTDITLYNITDQHGVSVCRRCHPECARGCSGEKAEDCIGCRNVEIRYAESMECLALCPSDMYPDAANRCKLCDDSCSGGCSGPSRQPGVGGCNRCHQVAMSTGNDSFECLPENVRECPKLGHFMRQESYNISAPDGHLLVKSTRVCYRCHPECRTCYEADNTHCKGDCFHLEEERKCVFNCSYGYFIGETFNTTCKRCTDDDQQREDCIGVALPVGQLSSSSLSAAIGIPIFVIICVLVVSGVILYVRERRRKLRQQLLDEIPITSTEAEPDLSSLRLIEESELRRGNNIGSGAFGTVYKGVWIPSKENLKIPVAIKVLSDRASGNLNVELLEEARVMASVKHQYCIRMLAVCMSSPMQLITPLMPHGCLLDYIRKNKSNIGSKSLLTWSVQIARGMEYLENRGIVHRDLAARNVLVQNANRVKITDFGLAKLLDYKSEEYQSTEGKMPIKWLALESLQHRMYTHKSDVWSYGVTLWEIFTYGQKPYEDINARAIPNALENGVRLPQPEICTIDVYLIMIKCWMVDASSRPCFAELAMEFTKMARDPGRYLVIANDQFMRLQSVASDSGELTRGLSGLEDLLDGPEQIISGEDYLRPNDLDFVDGIKSSQPQSFNHLLSIQEEDGYLNSNVGATARDSLTSPLLKPGMNPIQNNNGEYNRYIDDPCRADQPPRTLAPTIPKPQAKSQPKTDDCGYLDPQGVDQTGYLVVKDTTSPNSKTPASNPLAGPQEQYLNVTGLNNPTYYSTNGQPNSDYTNTNR